MRKVLTRIGSTSRNDIGAGIMCGPPNGPFWSTGKQGESQLHKSSSYFFSERFHSSSSWLFELDILAELLHFRLRCCPRPPNEEFKWPSQSKFRDLAVYVVLFYFLVKPHSISHTLLPLMYTTAQTKSSSDTNSPWTAADLGPRVCHAASPVPPHLDPAASVEASRPSDTSASSQLQAMMYQLIILLSSTVADVHRCPACSSLTIHFPKLCGGGAFLTHSKPNFRSKTLTRTLVLHFRLIGIHCDLDVLEFSSCKQEQLSVLRHVAGTSRKQCIIGATNIGNSAVSRGRWISQENVVAHRNRTFVKLLCATPVFWASASVLIYIFDWPVSLQRSEFSCFYKVDIWELTPWFFHCLSTSRKWHQHVTSETLPPSFSSISFAKEAQRLNLSEFLSFAWTCLLRSG